ncbi:hypothetical protein FWH58_00860 [Candidatus Saccharibacteria bacterium]|nr:hypothetical protein [Candidatus Saccharibacteria bacterium]
MSNDKSPDDNPTLALEALPNKNNATTDDTTGSMGAVATRAVEQNNGNPVTSNPASTAGGEPKKLEPMKPLDLPNLVRELQALPKHVLLYVVREIDSERLSEEQKAWLNENKLSLEDYQDLKDSKGKQIQALIARVQEQQKLLHFDSRHDPIGAALGISEPNSVEKKGWQTRRRDRLGRAALVAYLMENSEQKIDVRMGFLAPKDNWHYENLSKRPHHLRALATQVLAWVGIETPRVKGTTKTLEEYRTDQIEELKKLRRGTYAYLGKVEASEIYGGDAYAREPWSLAEMTDLQKLLKRQTETGKSQLLPGEENQQGWHQRSDSYAATSKYGKPEALSKSTGFNSRLEEHHAVHAFLQKILEDNNPRLHAALSGALFQGGDSFSNIDIDGTRKTVHTLMGAVDATNYLNSLAKVADTLQSAVNNEPEGRDTPEGKAWAHFLKKHRNDNSEAKRAMRSVIENAEAAKKKIEDSTQLAKQEWERIRDGLKGVFDEGKIPHKSRPERYTYRKVTGRELLPEFTHEIGMDQDGTVTSFDVRNLTGADGQPWDVADVIFIEVRKYIFDESNEIISKDEHEDPGGHVVGYIDTRTSAPVGNKPIVEIQNINPPEPAQPRAA